MAHYVTLLCAIALCGFHDFRGRLLHAFLPQAPNRPRDVAPETPVSFPASLPFGNASLQVGFRIGMEVRLSQGDAVDDRVKSPVPAAVKAMARQARGRCFERERASVGGELSLTLEAAARAQHSRERAGRKQVDAAELCQRFVPIRGEQADLLGDIVWPGWSRVGGALPVGERRQPDAAG